MRQVEEKPRDMCGREGGTELTPGSERAALCVCASKECVQRGSTYPPLAGILSSFVSYNIWECGAQHFCRQIIYVDSPLVTKQCSRRC
jgi:hypothetical protein